MSPTIALAVAIGGSIGATVRFTVGRHVRTTWIPGATLLVNVLGSLLLGLLVGLDVSDWTLALLGLGLCGALTTFASFAIETVTLWERGSTGKAAGYALGTLLLSGLGVALGWVGGTALA